MKKLLLSCVYIFLFVACTDKNQYEQAILTQLKNEQDIKDYAINPEEMTDCIVESTSKKMPGLFPLDPERMMAYRYYTAVLSMSTKKDKKQAFNELRSKLGTPELLRNARSNYTESFMTCINIFVQRLE